ncbi:MAG TPA: 30S ribosomal protein S16 [Bacteroidetes bacterium]|nr:30S ribosomal protein S16 [Bacteroidota bacterium]
MAVKIRLQRKGKKKKPFYHIVIADARAKRDGRFIEKIGTYNPLTVPATIELDRDKAFDWLNKGAQPTDTVRSILRFKGVTYRKHLQKGVAKGALTQEQADEKLKAWIEAKEAKIAKRREAALAEKRAFQAKVAGLDIAFSKPEKVVPTVEVKEEAKEAASEEEE